MTAQVASITNPNTARCSTNLQPLMTGACTGTHREGRRAMLVILALIILVIFDVYVLKQIDKHEIGIAELLRIHPELWEEDTDDE